MIEFLAFLCDVETEFCEVLAIHPCVGWLLMGIGWVVGMGCIRASGDGFDAARDASVYGGDEAQDRLRAANDRLERVNRRAVVFLVGMGLVVGWCVLAAVV